MDPITVTIIVIISGGATAAATKINPWAIFMVCVGFLIALGLPFAAITSLIVNHSAGTLTPTTIAAAIWVLGNFGLLALTITLDSGFFLIGIFNVLFFLICIFPILIWTIPFGAILIVLGIYFTYLKN